jgi:hypothetical protein
MEGRAGMSADLCVVVPGFRPRESVTMPSSPDSYKLDRIMDSNKTMDERSAGAVSAKRKREESPDFLE